MTMPEKPAKGDRKKLGPGRSTGKRERPDRAAADDAPEEQEHQSPRRGGVATSSSPPEESPEPQTSSERLLANGQLVSSSADAKSEKSPRSLKKAEPGSGKVKARERRSEPDAFVRAKATLPIAWKISGLTAIIVAGLMVFLSIYAANISEQKVTQEINLLGVTTSRMLAETVGREWAEGPSDMAPGMAEEARLQILNEWEGSLARRWDARFTALGSAAAEILDARIVDTGRQTILGVHTGQVSLANRTTLTPDGETTIEEGLWGTTGGTERARWFTHPIKDPLRGRVGEAWVIVRASAIDDVRSSLYAHLFLGTVIGLFGALALSGFMAVQISKPIRDLMRDMETVASGRLDHRSKVKTRDEVGVLAAAFNDMTKGLQEAQAAESEKQAIAHELEIATEIQTKLLPDRIPQIPGFDIFSHYLSAKEVGGDYYDFIVVDQTHLGIVVADVSGKGIPGSMVMTMTRSLIRLASHRNASPADTLKKVNRILAKDMRRGMFVTCCYVVLDVKERSIRVCSAGHNPLIYYDAQRKVVETVNPSGIALGFDKGPIFEANIQEQEIKLGPGDRIVVYTDGVIEAMNEKSDEFGDERFHALIQEHAALPSKDFINVLAEALDKHRGKAEQSDDITITTLLRVE